MLLTPFAIIQVLTAPVVWWRN